MRLVGTSVAARFLRVSARQVLRYIECGTIPPAACDRNLGPRGHHRIDLNQLHDLRAELEENRTNRTSVMEE